jgi:hypothetical protein
MFWCNSLSDGHILRRFVAKNAWSQPLVAQIVHHQANCRSLNMSVDREQEYFAASPPKKPQRVLLMSRETAMTTQINQVNLGCWSKSVELSKALLEMKILRFNGGSQRCEKQKPS